MNPEEQQACLKFIDEFHQSPVFWEGEEKYWSLIFFEEYWQERPEHVGVTSSCLSVLRDTDAYCRWIVWALEQLDDPPNLLELLKKVAEKKRKSLL